MLNEDYLLTLSDFEKEKILRKYVATNTTENTYYDFDDHFINISDYFEEPDFTFELPEPISNNKTLVIINGGIPIVTVHLYYQDQYLRTENFYQYDYCNIDLRETAHKMGIDYISVCNLYQQVHNMLKTTNNPRAIEILNKIINGLKTGNMNRADINNLIVDLNNTV